MNILQYTKEKSVDLADYLEKLVKSTLRFKGNNPLIHSSYNHIHLWKLEYLAERYNWIDSEYKIDFINYILRQWKIRLKGLAPYHEKGYRIYVYEDLSPSISVVAETDTGFPYDSSNAVFTNNISNIVNIPVIASGGAGEMEHFVDAFSIGKADAALAASIFHFNEISMYD